MYNADRINGPFDDIPCGAFSQVPIICYGII